MLLFSFIMWSTGRAKFTICQLLFFFLFFFFCWLSLGQVVWCFVWISKSQRILCVSFPRRDSELCIYHLFVWSSLNFLPSSQWITLPTQSCLVLYSFCANLLHSLIMCGSFCLHHYIIYICFLIIIPCKFFTSALTDGLTLESEWQQVSSSLYNMLYLSVMFFLFLYLILKQFSFLCIWLLVCPCVFFMICG